MRANQQNSLVLVASVVILQVPELTILHAVRAKTWARPANHLLHSLHGLQVHSTEPQNSIAHDPGAYCIVFMAQHWSTLAMDKMTHHEPFTVYSDPTRWCSCYAFGHDFCPFFTACNGVIKIQQLVHVASFCLSLVNFQQSARTVRHQTKFF